MSEQAHGFKSVAVALLCNSFITVIKFVGWAMSGSGAMFSEAVHSLADAMNQALLMIGIKRSQKAADDDHQFGYGQERYFWNVVSASGVFFIGCGVTLYHGVHSIFLAEHPDIDMLTFVILGVSLILEAISFRTAIKEVRDASGLPLKEAIRSGDPTTIAILLEDGVALLGVVLAFAAIVLTKATGVFWFDTIASILIGLMLGVVAIILANINRKYLIEVAMPDDVEDKLMAVIKSTNKVESVHALKSSTLNVGEYRVRFKAVFHPECLMDCPDIDSPEKIMEHLALEVAELKKNIVSVMPCVKVLTIELGTRQINR